MNIPSAGCVRTASGQYRPLVFVTHQGVYFSVSTFPRAGDATGYALECIESGDSVYLQWHYHEIVTDH